ncbi:MAG: hypothetical protein KAR38_01285, partial [Calditrichia bacterium]|nr:hypothetical protein [Calditrichia bacterium]
LLTLTAIVATMFILTKKTDKNAVEKVALETEEINKKNNEDKKEEIKEETPIEIVKINNMPFIGYIFLTLFLIVSTVAIASGKLIVPAFASYINYILLAGSSITAMWEFLRHRPEHPFRDKRFLFFIFALMPVQTLFAHNWLTLPYYLDRAFQGSVVGEYFEFFANLNPILIFILAPVVAGLTARANVYRMMILGTLVMALPTFLLAFGPNMYLFLAYILIMSVGEAMWQPRFLQWIAEIAPKGKTGAYMGIGQMPWFLTKVFTGMYSGYFVANHIPMVDSGMPLKTESMWLIYALIAMVSPIVLIIAKNWMSKGMQQKSA